jgi:hypothetical protein
VQHQSTICFSGNERMGGKEHRRPGLWPKQDLVGVVRV